MVLAKDFPLNAQPLRNLGKHLALPLVGLPELGARAGSFVHRAGARAGSCTVQARAPCRLMQARAGSFVQACAGSCRLVHGASALASDDVRGVEEEERVPRLRWHHLRRGLRSGARARRAPPRPRFKPKGGGFLGPLVYPDLERSQKSIEAAVRLVLPISPELFISK